MPAANTMTGGNALLLSTNTENCIYQSANGLQRCGSKIGEPPPGAPPQPGESKTPLSDTPRWSAMLAHKRVMNATPPANENGLSGRNMASIRDKISRWEGLEKKEPASPQTRSSSPTATAKGAESTKKDDGGAIETQRGEGSRKLACWERQDSGKENVGKLGDLRPKSPEGPGWREREKRERERGASEKGDCGMRAETVRDKRSVSTHIEKLERAVKDSNGGSSLGLPGNYFTPPLKGEQGKAERRATEPIFGSLGVVSRGPSRGRRGQDPNNVYTEPGSPSINPLPKPQRTFRHHTPDGIHGSAQSKSRRNLPPLPSIPAPPLPTCPPPTGAQRRARADWRKNTSNRKSFEFEDVLQVSPEARGVDWDAQSKTSLAPAPSEENVYEDILDQPAKENPYEDIELARPFLDNKSPRPLSPSSPPPDTPTKLTSRPVFFRQNSERLAFKLLDLRKSGRDGGVGSPPRSSPPSTPSSPDEMPCPSGEAYGRRRRKIPKLVLKINGIFEARRGKKHVKRMSQSAESSSGRVTDDNSESESDTEEKLKVHSLRLVSVQSMLKQTGRCRTLERDLMELTERQLFEYFLVVALHKAKAGAPYLPEVTQQFPLKLERSFKFLREREDQLKLIPQFCFPDAKDWAPVDCFPSETFSFVLTGEDGSRRFGYCRRLLPGGKGRRLPEVYCIVSRLGCFDLFSKILDEVEKRRAISPALVQPFMRAVMEAPFPAPGRTITVKNFLPGAGIEVIELCRPSDSRLEHVDFECLFSSLSLRLLLRVFASLLLERRVIFTADKLSTLSQCCHAVVALLYPFTWQHTYIPVLPPSMIDIICTPTPFIVGLLSSSLPRLKELPVEEVLVVDLGNSRFLRQVDDEDSILPHKLQSALEQVLERRRQLACEAGEGPGDSASLSVVVSEAFVRFFVEVVGHYPLFLSGGDREEELPLSSSSSSPSPTPPYSTSSSFQREAFRKAVSSKSLRRFLEVFMETQMFAGFVQERELCRNAPRGLFEVRAQEYLDSLPGSEHRGVNKFLKGLGSKMKFLSKK
ncbi:DENN domain-containing protein 2A [Anguilla rostrata]|uniref:DENN domain-containing protein 2A n=1 Tax=Anguilla rostrata TaxID=7938 RepID=UPI0030D2D235